MKLLSQVKRTVVTSLSLWLIICARVFTARVVLTGVHASEQAATQAVTPDTPAENVPEAAPPSETGETSDEESPSSDPPAGDQNNSNGDDVIIRIIR